MSSYLWTIIASARRCFNAGGTAQSWDGCGAAPTGSQDATSPHAGRVVRSLRKENLLLLCQHEAIELMVAAANVDGFLHT